MRGQQACGRRCRASDRYGHACCDASQRSCDDSALKVQVSAAQAPTVRLLPWPRKEASHAAPSATTTQPKCMSNRCLPPGGLT